MTDNRRTARRGVALVPEGRRVFSRMTVREPRGRRGDAAAQEPGRMNDVFELFRLGAPAAAGGHFRWRAADAAIGRA